MRRFSSAVRLTRFAGLPAFLTLIGLANEAIVSETERPVYAERSGRLPYHRVRL
jgi:hypothetical protein